MNYEDFFASRRPMSLPEIFGRRCGKSYLTKYAFELAFHNPGKVLGYAALGIYFTFVVLDD